MTRQILTLILFVFTTYILAVPALRIRRSITLSDGRTVMATVYGDEHLDYLLSDDGEVILEQNGIFQSTGLSKREFIAAYPQGPLLAQTKIGSVASALLKPTGTKKVPVILAAFDDKPFSVGANDSQVQSFYNEFFNGADIYASTGNWGSVRQYFIDQSLRQFQPEFAIIGPVQLDSVYSFYGADAGNAKDVQYSRFIRESFEKAQEKEKDWKQFDNDNDGKVDMCVVIFAGLGQNYTNSYNDKNTIWPQERPSSHTVNGITLAGCTSSCELRPTAASGGYITGTQADGVGVVIHEISHAIGLPDLYDTRNKEFGLDYWSIMDYGMYTRNSKVPVGYTAYEREFLGWQQTETLNGPCTLHLKSFDQGGKGYKLVNDANPDEYYILDNRQAHGWDWGVCSNRGHGMLVMHVDYASSAWSSNTVNTDPAHQRLTIIPANGTLIGSNNATSREEWQTSLQGNPYPGITGNHELTNDSYPASTVFTGKYMNKPLYDIEETVDGTITVKVMPKGTLDAPKNLGFEDTKPGSTTAIWDDTQDTNLYNLRLIRQGEVIAQVDSIAGTSYRLDNLKIDTDYTFAVQAINDGYRNSLWMESESFKADPDAISDISESKERVRIYDMRGRLIGECFADELQCQRLGYGIYVVQKKNGETKKLIMH